MAQDLKAPGLKVTVDTPTGVLRLPDDILFDTGAYELSIEGRHAASIVAGELRLGAALLCRRNGGQAGVPGQGTPPGGLDPHRAPPESRAPGGLRTGAEQPGPFGTEGEAYLPGNEGARPDLLMLVRIGGAQRPPIFGVSGHGEMRPVPVARAVRKK